MGVGMGTWTLAHTCDQQLCLLSLMLLGETQQAGGRCGVGWRARVGARVGPTLCVPHPVLLPGVFFPDAGAEPWIYKASSVCLT